MKRSMGSSTCRAIVAALLIAPAMAAAWGPDGHSIVAEIAQRRLDDNARAQVERLFGKGHSLASEASWADDVRAERPQTFRWHFVDIPLAADTYEPSRDCRFTAKGDCIVAALRRTQRALRCGDAAGRREALRWATHLVADLHQPLHTVGDDQGGNTIPVEAALAGLRCPRCIAARSPQTLHGIWDASLVAATTWNWGAYVERLEHGWLADAAAHDGATGSPEDWTRETHAVAREVWSWTPRDGVVGDDYYLKALPVLDAQLGRAGLRLAAFLNESLRAACVRSERQPRVRR